MEVLSYSFEFFLGYFLTALAYYFNHRFLFHKRTPKWMPKVIKKAHRWYANFHTQHHIHAWPDSYRVHEFIRIPLFGKIMMGGIALATTLISPLMALGILTFFTVYWVRHSAIHGISVLGNKPLDDTSPYYQHHMLHHTNGNWHKSNFSGVHPWIDKVFGTFKESQ